MRKIERIFAGTLAIFVCALVQFAAAQQTMTPQQALERVFKQSPANAEWFAPTFLAQVPVTQIDVIVKQYVAALGAFQHTDSTADGFTVVMEHGTAPAKLHLDGQGRIDGLWFGTPEPFKGATLDDLMKQLDTLPGNKSALVLEDDQMLASIHPDNALAVGSAFKMAILAAADEQVKAGKLRMDESFSLKKNWKSLGGVLHTWPEGTPLTLATLENEMISISDNTAADAMLSIVGREQAEKFAPPRNKPFLNTREAFVLKAKGNEALLDRYRKADEGGRRALLGEIDAQPLPDARQFGDSFVTAPDVEWFFTAKELCTLISSVADEPAMHINPGLPKPAEWQQVAFKGGNEGGVMNLTLALKGRNGKHYCVVAMRNDNTPLDHVNFLKIFDGILDTLESRSTQ